MATLTILECDLCKEKSKSVDDTVIHVHWGKAVLNIQGGGKQRIYDLCPECIGNLIAALSVTTPEEPSSGN